MKMEKSKANRKTVAQKFNQKKIVLHQEDKNKWTKLMRTE